MHVVALGLTLLLGPADQVAAGDTWPQWRGPTANSVAATKGLPLKWSQAENIVWKTPLPGWGTSTPAIWGEAIFVTTQNEDRLLLMRVDTSTGKVHWQREVGHGVPRRSGDRGNLRFHEEHNMASPSPITDGKHVWAHFGNGDLACYTFAGDKVWDMNFAKAYGTLSIWWGRANSPVLVGDLIVSVCMQDPKLGGQSYVVAHEKLTGKQKWFTPRDTGATSEPADAYTTPLVFDNKGHTELLVYGGNVLDAYDPATGK
jgi:outer membrane protein assembly factor BamB